MELYTHKSQTSEDREPRRGSYFNAMDDNVSYSLRSIWCHETFFSPDRAERHLLERIS